jgi:hypothetical protein
MSGKQSRSVYVAQLRRAFLMRAHPDRFRGRSESIRRGQTSLLSALSERMGQQDFQDYTTNIPNGDSKWHGGNQVLYKYVLEKRDGSLFRQNLQLDDSVENVLKSMARALQLSGAALPPPPSPPESKTEERLVNMRGKENLPWPTPPSSKIDHQFDVNTTRGRDLWGFLACLDFNFIENRRASRIDAAAAALVARRLYVFQAIDGISMGWSSASFAILLKSLIKLHEEHNARFHVDSFYPLRLVFSNDEFHKSLDLFSGHIYLNPAWTPLQWLESLQEVTTDRLEEFRQNRLRLQEQQSLVQNSLGVKMKKGYSCSSEEYHMFIGRLSQTLNLGGHDQQSRSPLVEQNILVTVESSSACRQARVTREGGIRVNSSMTEGGLRGAITRMSLSARDCLLRERDEQERCDEAIHHIQWELGLQRVYRTGIVSHSEFAGALSRLLENRLKLKGCLSGFSLGIAGSGQFCHLGDDGSVIIPFNWQ